MIKKYQVVYYVELFDQYLQIKIKDTYLFNRQIDYFKSKILIPKFNIFIPRFILVYLMLAISG